MSNVLGIPIPEDFKDAIGMAADNLAASWETRLGQVATEQLTEDMLMLAMAGNLFTIDQWWLDHEEDIKDRWNRAFIPILIMLALAQGTALCASLGITITLSYIYTTAWAAGIISEMNDFIYATTADNLRVLIQQATDENWDLRTLRDRILLIYEQWINGNLDVEEDFEWFNRRAPVHRTCLISETESILTVSMAALALYLALGIELTQWWTAQDERVCFPENTMVLTRTGEHPIQNIKEGDFIKTRQGWNKVTGASKRLYSGPMTSINIGDRSLSATSNHPIWKHGYGWLPIGDFKVGDSVQIFTDETREVVSAVNFRLSDMDNVPSLSPEISISLSAFLDILMPIIPIGFYGNLATRNGKINTVFPNLGLLDIFKFEIIEGLSDFFLNRGFALKFSIAGEATKFPIVRGGGAKGRSAVSTFNNERWPSAFLRTIMAVKSFLRSKYLSAPFAFDVFGIGKPAFLTTNGIPIGIAPWNGKLFSTLSADLCYPSGAPIAFLRAERPVLTRPSIELLSALRTRFFLPSSRLLMITLARAKHMLTGSLDSLREFFSAIFADVFERHNGVHSLTNVPPLYHRSANSQIYVYDLTVDGAHEFYANGILVHNCPWCGELHGAVIDTGEPWLEAGDIMDVNGAILSISRTVLTPPLHSRCRCFLAPYFG